MGLLRSLALGIACAAFAVGASACGARTALEGAQGRTSGTGAVGAGAFSGATGNAGVRSTLCGSLLDASCTFYLQCESPPPLFKDLDRCRSELDCYGVPALFEAIDAGRVALDESAVAQCFSDFYAEPCAPSRDQASLQNDPLDIYQFLAGCPGVLTPLQGVGDTCYADAEC